MAAMMAMATGCRNQDHTSLWQQIRSLSEENSKLTVQVEQLKRDNVTLTEQVETLAAIEPDVRIAAMTVPESIRIARHTGFYDKTSDGKPDSLIVHLEPFDANQDAVKAAGRVEVELWNLAASSEQARLGLWQVNADELKGLWGRGLTGSYYRLTFPLEDILKGDEKELTVRVRFTDYVTGRILTDQRVVKR